MFVYLMEFLFLSGTHHHIVKGKKKVRLTIESLINIVLNKPL